jgi:[ribosomal protein S5]-alanine N-acetyltransferase
MLNDIPDLVSLETERLLLRELSPRIYDHAFGTFSDISLKHFFGYDTDEEIQKEKERYEAGMESFNKSYFIFHIIEKTSGKVIGSIGYHTWYKVHDRAEIFYMIRDIENRQQGYASEAIAPVIDYGFHQMKLNRIEAFLSPHNIASVKLVSKNGFRKEGTLKGHYLINERYEDSDVYGLLKNEYLHPH